MFNCFQKPVNSASQLSNQCTVWKMCSLSTSLSNCWHMHSNTWQLWSQFRIFKTSVLSLKYMTHCESNLRLISCDTEKICSWRFEIGPWTWYKSGLRKPVYLVWATTIKYNRNNLFSLFIQSQFHLNQNCMF